MDCRQTSKAVISPGKGSLQKSKNQFQYFVYFLGAHYRLLFLWKIHI